MKTISKLVILNICFLLLSFAVADVCHGASAVKGLNIYKIKGKPGIDWQIKNPSNTQEFIRLMELLIIGTAPDSVPIEQLVSLSSGSEGPLHCILAARHLTATERAKVLKITPPTRASCVLNLVRFIWAGRHKLEREDSKKLFKEKYLPQIKEAAAKVASFQGFREIIIVNKAYILPDNYSRSSGGFSFSWKPGNGIPLLSMKDSKPITVWKVNETKARQLMGGLLAPKQVYGKTHYPTFQVEEIIELHGAVKTSTGYKILGRTKSIVLYEDKARTKILHRFAMEDFTNMAAIAAREAQAGEQARLAKLEKVKLAGSQYFSAAYAELSGKGLKLVDEMMEFKRYGGSPFEIKSKRKKDHARMTKKLKEELSRFDRNETVWISGTLTLSSYNIDQSYFPLHKATVYIGEDNRGDKDGWVSVRLIQSQIVKLPIPSDMAKRMSLPRGGGYAGIFRALVKPVNTPGPGRTLELAIVRLELLKTPQHTAILDDKNVIWRYTPPGYKTFLATAAQQKAQEQKNIAELKKVCAATKDNPISCYSKLCSKIMATGDMEGYKSCTADSGRAFRKWKDSQWAAINAKEAARMKNKKQNMVNERMCRGRYTGSAVQSWMPVKGTPEFKAAMTACQNEPVRAVYGPDILGLRLGMPLSDAKNFIKRQSIKYNTTLKDTRPFEKASLYWSEDANHGIAVFSLVNGEHERVAAVSRRLYMGDKKMTAGRVIDGLRKKYGRELWSSGGRTLLWASPEGSKKPSAKKCSGLAELVEPRAGWNRTWATGTKRATAREQRQAAAMAAVAPQQECMAKHGMPASPEDMQVLARCIRELAANATAPPESSGASGSGARLPFMVKASGTSGLYAGYESCGVVTIAHLNTDDAGIVQDISSVLFDPSWLARQPAFAFGSGGGEDQIDF